MLNDSTQLRRLFFKAVKKGNVQRVYQILKSGKVDINAQDGDGDTALHWAVGNDEKNLGKLLLNFGINPNLADTDAWTPLHLAIDWRETTFAELILRYGADPNLRNSNGYTPLHLAVLRCLPEGVQLLLNYGASPVIKDCSGKPPFAYCEDKESAKALRKMLPWRERFFQEIIRLHNTGTLH